MLLLIRRGILRLYGPGLRADEHVLLSLMLPETLALHPITCLSMGIQALAGQQVAKWHFWVDG